MDNDNDNDEDEDSYWDEYDDWFAKMLDYEEANPVKRLPFPNFNPAINVNKTSNLVDVDSLEVN